MNTYLVIVTLILSLNSAGSYQVKQEDERKPLSSYEECMAMKRQREFLPPPIPNSTQMFFCIGEEE